MAFFTRHFVFDVYKSFTKQMEMNFPSSFSSPPPNEGFAIIELTKCLFNFSIGDLFKGFASSLILFILFVPLDTFDCTLLA